MWGSDGWNSHACGDAMLLSPWESVLNGLWTLPKLPNALKATYFILHLAVFVKATLISTEHRCLHSDTAVLGTWTSWASRLGVLDPALLVQTYFHGLAVNKRCCKHTFALCVCAAAGREVPCCTDTKALLKALLQVWEKCALSVQAVFLSLLSDLCLCWDLRKPSMSWLISPSQSLFNKRGAAYTCMAPGTASRLLAA